MNAGFWLVVLVWPLITVVNFYVLVSLFQFPCVGWEGLFEDGKGCLYSLVRDSFGIGTDSMMVELFEDGYPYEGQSVNFVNPGQAATICFSEGLAMFNTAPL